APAQRFGLGRAVACDLEAEAESRQVRQVPPRGRRSTDRSGVRLRLGSCGRVRLGGRSRSRQATQAPPRGRRSTDRTTRACGTLTTAQCKRVTHLEQVASVIWERVCL